MEKLKETFDREKMNEWMESLQERFSLENVKQSLSKENLQEIFSADNMRRQVCTICANKSLVLSIFLTFGLIGTCRQRK